MPNPSVKGDKFEVTLDLASHVVAFRGSLRLINARGYAPVVALLDQALDLGSPVVLDLRQLAYINSAGLQALVRFIVRVRDAQAVCTIQASRGVLWHSRSLPQFQHLLPSLAIEFS